MLLRLSFFLFFTTTRTTMTTFLECPADRHLTNMFKSDKSIVLFKVVKVVVFSSFYDNWDNNDNLFCVSLFR